jgi:Lrp/AsnC family transcriptional regulator, leucine-responsive regulatory protein
MRCQILPRSALRLASSAMDRIDRAILAQLAADGRLANTELADRVGLSPSPCLRRVRSLERSGVITGYYARVDPAAISRGFEVLLHVEMARQDRATLESFETLVAQIEAVTECRRMFGQPDYLIWIATADLDSYERLYMAQLTDLPGVARTHSQFTMKTVKASAGLPGVASDS